MIVEFFGSGGSGGGGGTNTNLATNELIQANTTRSFRTAGSGYLTFNQNDGTNVVKILDTGAFEIGGASPYSMPTARGTTGELLNTNYPVKFKYGYNYIRCLSANHRARNRANNNRATPPRYICS